MFPIGVEGSRTQADAGEGTVEVSPATGGPGVRVTAGRSPFVRGGEAPGQPVGFNRITDPELGSGVKPIVGHGR